MTSVVALTAIALGVLAVPALASERGPYVAARYGVAKTSGYSDLEPVTYKDDTAGAWKIALGYALTPTYAAEIAYTRLGTFKAERASGAGSFFGEWSANGVQLTAVANVPLAADFALQARLGALFWSQHADVDVEGVPSGNPDQDGVSPSAGVGGRYRLNPALELEAGYEAYFGVGDGSDEFDRGWLWAGLSYRFQP